MPEGPHLNARGPPSQCQRTYIPTLGPLAFMATKKTTLLDRRLLKRLKTVA